MCSVTPSLPVQARVTAWDRSEHRFECAFGARAKHDRFGMLEDPAERNTYRS
jgi:hypothetical protein